MNALSLTLITLACVLIGFGRGIIRRARRTDGTRKRRLVGWALCFAGLLCMIAGVTFWGEVVLR